MTFTKSLVANKHVLMWAIVLGALLAAGTITALLQGYEYVAWTVLIGATGMIAGFALRDGHGFGVGWAAGFVATLVVGLLQVAFMELYFANNPEYAEIVDSLPLSPEAFTLALAPLQGAAFGVVSGLIAFVAARLRNSPDADRPQSGP